MTPIGTGAGGLWSGVRRGHSAVRRLTRFDPAPFRSQVSAEINDFDPLTWMNHRSAHRLDRFAQFGVATARQALDDAKLHIEACRSGRIGVSLGSALGGIAYGEQQHEEFVSGGMRRVSPNVAIAVYGGASGANIAIELGLRGANLSNASSCASGAIAIGEALRLIQRDEADIMLAGGAEAPLAPLTFGSFALIKAMSTRNDEPESASRPFDEDRDGFVMGEGAALLVLEEQDSAIERGARMYCELVGYGHTNDAYHMTAPRPDGSEAARAIQLALTDGAVSAGDVDYINAHATGTPLGDAAESRAIRCALGPSGRAVPVSGTKGLYGHALGASGAIEAAITAMAIDRGFLPGTTNLSRQARDCRLNLVPACGREAFVERALSTSFGFGGSNSALVFQSVRISA
ncbi:MAG: beta-ketoacyl-[acyl-carrier-protein] synthase II [Chloroflexi bacterium]|nr:MAG: beta-ketoacyl-[acyl-carrier-protein] synthase II [Chloroflexota bacterium]